MNRDPLALFSALLGISSVATLLLYFAGTLALRTGVLGILLPAIALVPALVSWAGAARQDDLRRRVLAGLWAGALATFAYDVVRIPISLAGVPVFKAISYFGTLILERRTPDVWSEIAGWTYHLSNGVGFGLVYASLCDRPRWWSAVAWGVTLEAVMLLTPYAEIFGYKISRDFLAITIGAHVVYGLTLWLALLPWTDGARFPARPRISRRTLVLAGAGAPLGIAAIAVAFHVQHARAIPLSPPTYVGRHLYTTWDVLEPDRLAAMWMLSRFVDPGARFHFIPPFTIAPGQAFDTPEASVRRTGMRSATEVLLENPNVPRSAALERLAAITHLQEITPWLVPTDPDAQGFVRDLMAAAGRCPAGDVAGCAEGGLRHLDAWYAAQAPGDRPAHD